MPNERVWSVREVMDNRQLVNGKTVTVRGWIEHCQRLSCAFYDSPSELRTDHANVGYWLGVGGHPSFDREAAAHIPGYVVLTARVDIGCMNDPKNEVIALCTDRATTLSPLHIVRWER
jgi:hypothetical protein